MTTLVATADAWRGQIWKLSPRFGIGRVCSRDRSARLAVLASGHMFVALILAVVAPLWLLLLGPLLLGVPHVVGDLRYLVLRPARAAGIGRSTVAMILLPLAGMTALRTIALFGGPASRPEVEVLLGVATVAAAIALPSGSLRRRLSCLAVAIPLSITALAHPGQVVLWLGHLHNLVAFGLWLALYDGEGPRWRTVAVGGLFLACCGALATGILEPIAVALGSYQAAPGGLDMAALARGMAPGLDPVFGFRMVVVFVFAQSIHYVVWLRLIPGRCDRRTSAPTFRRSLADLRQELGTIGLGLCAAIALLVPILALFDPIGVRSAYLPLVLFHGWHEIAFVAVLVLAGRRILE